LYQLLEHSVDSVLFPVFVLYNIIQISTGAEVNTEKLCPKVV